MQDHSLDFYHSPNSRSVGVRILLEELGAPYTLHVLNMNREEQRQPAYLAVNPTGKVPAIVQDGALVTEQPAIFIHLADLFPAAGLAPALGDPLRGPYLRWLVYYGSAFEPAIIDKALQRDAGGQRMSPYGDYDSVVNLVSRQVEAGPWILGERMTAADILWGTALGWVTSFKLMPETPAIANYVARIAARPASIRVREADAALAAEQAAATRSSGSGG